MKDIGLLSCSLGPLVLEEATFHGVGQTTLWRGPSFDELRPPYKSHVSAPS